ncbi:MAG TPA: DUF427 domain-containing protein [Acidimicrobiales bacterium]|nr:DUF427 domain-containing protein [Acidimicrobiales bacterium]
MTDHPAFVNPPESVQPVPRRIRGFVDGGVVFDTTNASYVWEHSRYPQYYVPLDDVVPHVLVPEGHVQKSPWGTVETHGLKNGGDYVTRAAKVVTESSIERLSGTVRFNWDAIDAWFEEDERVFVHPRNPYVRVDALRSTRSVRVELNGEVLAESFSPVMVFETGLPTRYYVNRTDVELDYLVPSDTVTACPYKGTTSQYWSADFGGTRVDDIAWSYDFPTVALAPIAGLMAFYNEKVDLYLDGNLLERPAAQR